VGAGACVERFQLEAVMLTNVAFTVPGDPQGKGRARVGKIGGHARMFTPAKTVAYEGLIAMAAQQAMAGCKPFVGACAVEVECVFAMPKSMSKKHRVDALAGRMRPTKKPDGDNVLKAVCDGINGVVWVDDVQAVDSRVIKRYGETPCVQVRVALLDTQLALL
jgi:Holliday junction resolvase RusA-like endonuclease